MPKEKKEEPTEKWIAQEVPTETKVMVVNTEEDKAYPLEAVLANILEKLERIENALVS